MFSFLKQKPRGATPATLREIMQHQNKHRGITGTLPHPALPAEYQPELTNNVRYQMWMRRKGVAA